MIYWYIASVPFWFLGSLFMIGVFAWIADVMNGKEKAQTAASPIIGSLVVAGCLFVLAAKLVS